MLRLNQLIVQFDNTIETISDQIHEFWDNLLNQREIKEIFAQGIHISDELNKLTKLLSDVESLQSDRETRIYLQMAQFYSQVVFKTNESYQMLDKARIAYQIKKISKIRGDRDDTSTAGGMSGAGTEKCMIMSDINIKKPMKVILMNKQALKLL